MSKRPYRTTYFQAAREPEIINQIAKWINWELPSAEVDRFIDFLNGKLTDRNTFVESLANDLLNAIEKENEA